MVQHWITMQKVASSSLLGVTFAMNSSSFPTPSEKVYMSEYFVLPRNRTSSEKFYLPITLVVKINWDNRQNIRLLSSLICGTRPGCRTYQSTFFTV